MTEIRPSSGSVDRGAPGVSLRWATAPLEPGFTSGVPLFIGFGRVRPEAEPAGGRAVRAVRLAGWDDFLRSVEPRPPGRYLSPAVRGFFENGGDQCVVLPLRAREPGKEGAPSA